MATIKSYTDLEQSKKLAEILPLESADMYYSDVPVREWADKTDISKGTHVIFKSQIFAIENLRNREIGEGDVYAWSLAALLNFIPGGQVNRMANSDKWEASSWNDSDFEPAYYVEDYDNSLDACVAMIEKLHELTMSHS